MFTDDAENDIWISTLNINTLKTKTNIASMNKLPCDICLKILDS